MSGSGPNGSKDPSNKELSEVLGSLLEATKGVLSATEQIAADRGASLSDAIKARGESIPTKAMSAFDKVADTISVLNDKASEAIGYVKPTASTLILGSWAGTLVQGVQAGVLGLALGNLGRISKRGVTLSELDKTPRLFLQVFRGLVKDPRFQHYPKIVYFAFVPSSQLKRTLIGLEGQGELAAEFAAALEFLDFPNEECVPIRPRRVYGPNEEKQMLHDALELRRAVGPDVLLLFYFYGVGGEVVPFSDPQLIIPAELGDVALVGDVDGSSPSVALPGAVRVEFSASNPRIVEVDGLSCGIIGYGQPMHVVRRDGAEVCVASMLPRLDDYRYLISLKVLVYSYQKLWPSLTTWTGEVIAEWFGEAAGSVWANCIGFPGSVSLGCHACAEYYHWRTKPTRWRLFLSTMRFGCMMAATYAAWKSRSFVGPLYGMVCVVAPELGFHFPSLVMRHAPALRAFGKKYFR